MAYWVGGSGNWSDAANHWAATSGGAPGAGNLPNSSVDAIFDANSGAGSYTVTVDATMDCRDFDMSAAAGAITLAGSASYVMRCYGSLALQSGMVRTWTGEISMRATTTGHTITMNGVSLAQPFTFNGVGGGWAMQDAFTITGTSPVTILAGAVDLNGQTVTVPNVASSSNTYVRSFTTGAATLTCTFNSGLYIIGSNATVDFTAVVAFNLIGTACILNVPDGTVFGGLVTINPQASIATIGNVGYHFTFNDLTVEGINSIYCAARMGGNHTINGTLKILGYSAARRIEIMGMNNSLMASRTLTVNAIDAASDFCDFTDITIAGAAAPWTAGTHIGDCGGNSGITFTPSATQTATGTASFTWSSHAWSGTPSRVPLPQDDVIIPNAFVAGQRVTNDVVRMGRDITFTCAGDPEFHNGVGGARIFGSLTMAPGMTTPSGGQNITFSGRGVHGITSAGLVWVQGFSLANPGGRYVLQDALTSTLASLGFNITYGELDLNGFTATFAGRVYVQTGSPALTFGTSTLIVNSGGGDAFGLYWSGGTISAANGTLKLANPRTQGFHELNLGNFTYGTLWISGTNYGPVRINHAYTGTFGTLKSDNPNCPLLFGAARTQTIGTWDVNGVAGSTQEALLWIANAVGNNITTPDSAAADITGDIAIVVHAMLTDWSSGDQSLVAKLQAAGQYSYQFYTNATGTLQFRCSTNGTALTGSASSAVAPFGDGTYQWAAATREASTGTIKYWTSADGASWTQLGVDRTSTAGNLFSSTSLIEIGTQLNGAAAVAANGKFRRAMIFNGIPPMLGGAASATPAVDFNPADYVSGRTWVSATGETWTLNGGTAIVPQGLIHVGTSSDAAHTLSKSGAGLVSANCLSIRRSTATPADTWYATNSIDQGDNNGWVFGAHMAADAGSFDVTGNDATLVYTPVVRPPSGGGGYYAPIPRPRLDHYSMTAAGGAYKVEGRAVELRHKTPADKLVVLLLAAYH